VEGKNKGEEVGEPPPPNDEMMESVMEKRVSQLDTMTKLTQGLLAIPVEMVKQRLLLGLETGCEIGILQAKKGKVVLENHFFQLVKNHRTLEYGTKDGDSFTLIGEVPISLIQSVASGVHPSMKFKKSEKPPSWCITFIMNPKEEKKKTEKERDPEEEFLCLALKEADFYVWMDGMKILLEGTKAICCAPNLETIKHLQRIGKEVGIIQQEREEYTPPVPRPPSNLDFAT